MCLTCGCGDVADTRILTEDGEVVRHDHARDEGHLHPHEHPHDHAHHPHDHAHHPHDDDRTSASDHTQHGPSATEDASPTSAGTETVVIEQAILAKNDHLAEHNRWWFDARGILALNLMSSPGSGKTTLLERTITDLRKAHDLYVVEGDQETSFDADRIRRAGARAVQVNTGAGCHLDAPMVQRAVQALQPTAGGWVFIENVGNLVCPALFDVGEHAKVVIISVTEGHDKPLKYPHMFSVADLVIVNKIDLSPYVDFDIDVLTAQARSLRPGVTILPLSARTGDGVEAWYAWLADRRTRS